MNIFKELNEVITDLLEYTWVGDFFLFLYRFIALLVLLSIFVLCLRVLLGKALF